MYLKALEIQGFKSFPEKTVLHFGAEVTAIVGPNGSGKSNISDAIRWVMGEQSTRALRGGKMEDVIFGGTEKRRQMGFSEVSLVLDNTSRYFDREESEVVVTRRYYRSGESEYYINRRSVRLKDVNELFMDTGLGREGYSIISQGKIDEILSVKSTDRREIFEEASGISRFRHRKEEAERKLGRANENLVRIGDKIDELELQVGPLRTQAEKAKKFLILRDELRILEISLWLEQLAKIRAGAIKVTTDFEHAVRERDEANAALERLYESAGACAEQMREKDIQADRLREQGATLDGEAGACERALSVLQSNIQNNMENAERIAGELNQQEGRAGSIGEQIEGRRTRLEEIIKKSDALTGELFGLTQADEALGRSAGTLAQELEALRQKEAMESADAHQAKALLSALAAAAQELMDRDEALRQERSALKEQVEAAAAGEGALAEELEQHRQERESVMNILGGYALRLDARRKKEKEADQRLSGLRAEEGALASRIRMLEEMEKLYEGYSKAVKVVMGEAKRGELRGVRGPVAGLLKAHDRYAVAIEIALGGAMQHIVVEREEDGKTAINYLKRRDAGRATFLPLSSIRPFELHEKGVENEPGFVGVASGLIEYEREYEPVFANLLGRVVVAQDMDTAIAMARKFGHRFKIVTLDGQVLNPGGSMTGGSVSRSAGILSRANEIGRLLEQQKSLRGDLTEAEKTLQEAAREAAAAAYELEAAQGRQRELEDAILTLTGRLEGQRGQLGELRARYDAVEGEIAQLLGRSAQIERDTEAARARIESLEGSAAALREQAEDKAGGQSTLRERREEIAQQTAALRAQQAALAAERGAAEQSISELESLRRDLDGDRAAREALLAELEEKNSALAAEMDARQRQLQALRLRGEEWTGTLKRLNEEKLALEAKRNQADKAAREQNTALLTLERSVATLEQRKNAAVMEEKQILDKLWDSYELSHEAAQTLRVELESVSKAGRRVAELRREISGLGNINLDAIEEFERVNERYTYLTDQRSDVEKARRELQQIIGEITREMKAIFAREFEQINAAFGETFRELFGGGRATLELEDPEEILDCGIEIKVQPPGKALKIISLLSGGEKAFVAIALYFAILKVRPTPFCVMDEIEAALDDVNVVRFAQYLRAIAQKTQFIIITHRRGTMEAADVLYGVTMQEQGVSRMLTIHLDSVEEELSIR